MSEIILKQHGVIQHDLLNVGKMVDERIKNLNIDNLVATSDTIQAMKSLRATLNAEFKEYEDQRKAVKNLISQPYSDMEVVYKEQVTSKYTAAIRTLKERIDEHELKIKLDIKEEVEGYFNELKEFADVDFVKFSDAKINITLSASMKSYKEEIDAFFKRIQDDLILIETQENQAEILTEYKKDLNCSRAIKEVSDRKYAEKREAERLALLKQEKRYTALANLALIKRQFENDYVHALHEDILISIEDVENLPDAEFDAIIDSFNLKIKERTTVTTPVSISEKEKPKMLKARFEVEGTLKQIQGLNEYLKSNKLTYKNIKL